MSKLNWPSFVGRIKCGIGKHDWRYRTVTTRSGFGMGQCCCRCGTWHPKESVRAPWASEEMLNEQRI